MGDWLPCIIDMLVHDASTAPEQIQEAQIFCWNQSNKRGRYFRPILPSLHIPNPR
jgi:hypothetical protein